MSITENTEESTGTPSVSANSGISESLLRRRKRKRERARERRKLDPEFRERSAAINNKASRKRRADKEKRNAELEYNKQRRLERRAGEPEYLETVRRLDRELQAKRREDPDYLLLIRNRKYCITKEQFEQLFAHQKGKCAICTFEFESIYSKEIRRDHCHSTHQLRGLLCARCNHLLGYLENLDFDISGYVKYVGSTPLKELGIDITVSEYLQNIIRKRKTS